MNKKAMFGIVALYAVIFLILSSAPIGKVTVDQSHGGKIAHGVDMDERGSEPSYLDSSKERGFSEYDIRLTNTSNDRTFLPIGHTNNSYGDAVWCLKNVVINYNFSNSINNSGDHLDNITIDWGDGSSQTTVSSDIWNHNFSHTYKSNGTFTLRMWGVDEDNGWWVDAAWTVWACDYYLQADLVYPSGTQLTSSALTYANADVHFHEEEITGKSSVGVYHHATSDGDEMGPVSYTGHSSYYAEDASGLRYIQVNNQNTSGVTIYDSSGLSYRVYGFYANKGYIHLWNADNNRTSYLQTTNLTSYSNGGGAITSAPDLVVYNASTPITNFTGTPSSDFSGLTAETDYNLYDYSQEFRTVLDLWGAFRAVDGVTWGDQEVTASETTALLGEINEELITEVFDETIPDDSTGLFVIRGKTFDYVDNSVAGTKITSGGYNGSSNLSVAYQMSYSAPSDFNTSRNSYELFYTVPKDGTVWNKTTTVKAPSGWDITSASPLSVDEFPDNYNMEDDSVFVDGEDETFTMKVLMEKSVSSSGASETNETEGAVGEEEEEAFSWSDWAMENWLTIVVLIIVLGLIVYMVKGKR